MLSLRRGANSNIYGNWPLPAASHNFGSLRNVYFPFHFQAFSKGGLYFTDCMKISVFHRRFSVFS